MHSLSPSPFAVTHHADNDVFSSLPLNNEFDDGDFDSLLNLDVVGEAFTFDEGVMSGAGMVDGALGDDWLAGGVGMAVEV
jgi:hypothetical protein